MPEDSQHNQTTQRFNTNSVLSACLLPCATVISFAALRVQPNDVSCDRLTYPWSPAFDVVRYHWETFEDHGFSLNTLCFAFDQTDELENAWHELLPSLLWRKEAEAQEAIWALTEMLH